MKLPKLFRFKHELFFLFKKFSKVRAPTSVTKMISRKYKFHELKRKIADFFEPSNPFWPDPILRVTAFLFG